MRLGGCKEGRNGGDGLRVCGVRERFVRKERKWSNFEGRR